MALLVMQQLCYVCQKDEHLRIQGTMPWPCCRLHCLLLQQSRGAILDFAVKLCYVCQKDEHLRIQGTMHWACCRLHCTSRSVLPKTARRATSSLSELFACIRPVANAAANRRRGSGISVSGPTFQDQKLVATAACPSVKHDDSGKGATSSCSQLTVQSRAQWENA